MEAFDRPRDPSTPARVVLVGGGLANCLLAYRLRRAHPELDLVVLESGETLGGNHVWCFHDADLTPPQHEWMRPLVARSWTHQEVRFPEYRRRVASGYHAVTSERLHDVLSRTLGERVRLATEVRHATAHRVVTADGETIEAGAVVDGRGFLASRALELAYQKFVGVTLHLSRPHGIAGPILMDATVEQRDGYRFLYTLPFDEHTLLVEDTRYSDTPALARGEIRADVLAYAADQGWAVERSGLEEAGVLPVVLAGDIEAYWDETGGAVPRSGLRAALVHPTTGYSLPEAVRVADELAALDTLASADLHARIRRRSLDLWRRGAFFRLLNRMLFRATEPELRYVVLQRFYRLDDALIARFYAGRPTLRDRIRVLSGKPPVSIGRALRCLRDVPREPAPESGA